ncbi:MAG: UDP-glucose/GDP-mannose dehydrogenase family protein [Betaproteobacteria bacterium]|nr:UDP-glucose/GDP-mannose dehydrogenase family protein [Betaproteobacteria bacterium]
MTLPLIGFAGLTHLGLVYGASALAKGFRVVAFDPDAQLVERLNSGQLPVLEPGLDDLYREHGAKVEFSTDERALQKADIVFISGDVATDDSGRSDLTRTNALIASATRQLRSEALLVVLCQVPPGFTRTLAVPLERRFYQVETLVFGQAVERALHPERFIVGCADPERDLPATYQALLSAFGCPVLRMGYESAELSKIAINCCLVASVSVANTLAELCERIGAAWPEIVPALKLDRRIGQYAYLAPGLGIAGGNLERDLATVIRFANEHGTDSGVVRAWVQNSTHRRDWAAHTIREALLDAKPEATVAVWGLAYKENTHSVKNSPSLATIAQLPGTRLKLHDPVVSASAVNHANAEAATDPLAAARDADALMILTPWPQYRSIAPAEIARALRGRIVLDPYGVLDLKAALAAGLDLYTLGRPPLRGNRG